jgi:hypothetical protein
VGALLIAGGPEAVVDELELLNSDYAIRRYVTALSEKADLSQDLVQQLIRRLSDLSGDYDLARSLEAVVNSQALDDTTLNALLTAASGIEGDYDKRRVITAIVEKGRTDASFDLSLALFESISSDHDLRVTAESLLDNKAIKTSHVARLLALSADRVGSDHDLRLILAKAAPRLSDDDIVDPWLEGFAAIGSDYDKRIALEAAAVATEENPALRARLREAAADIGSDHEREKALDALR